MGLRGYDDHGVIISMLGMFVFFAMFGIFFIALSYIFPVQKIVFIR